MICGRVCGERTFVGEMGVRGRTRDGVKHSSIGLKRRRKIGPGDGSNIFVCADGLGCPNESSRSPGDFD